MQPPAPPPIPVSARGLGRIVAVLAGVAAIGLGAVACASWTAERMARNITLEPGVAVLAVRPGAQGIPTSMPDLLHTEAVLALKVTVRNNNLVEVRLLDVAWQAQLNGSQVAQGAAHLPGDGLALRADTATEVPIEASVPLVAAGMAGIEAVQRGEAKIVISGVAKARALGITLERAFQMEIKDLRVELPLPGLGLPGDLTLPGRLPEIVLPGAGRDLERELKQAAPIARELGRVLTAPGGVLGVPAPPVASAPDAGASQPEPRTATTDAPDAKTGTSDASDAVDVAMPATAAHP